MGAIQQILAAGRMSVPYVFLDSLSPAPRACCSLRKFISTATNAVRVRRDSDNAEQDFGFSGSSAGAYIDSAALLSFVGAASGFITTVYDQTGNAEHIIQATATKQPRIVNAGVLDPAIRFDGTSDGMAITTLVLGAPTCDIFTRAAMVGPYSTPNYGVIYELGTDAVTVGGGTVFSWFDGGTGRWTIGSNTGGGGAGTTRTNNYLGAWPAVLTCFSFIYDTAIVGAGECLVRIAGVNQAVAASPTASNQTGNYRSDQNLNIGARNNGGTLFNRMDMETFLVYNASTASIRSQIEAALG